PSTFDWKLLAEGPGAIRGSLLFKCPRTLVGANQLSCPALSERPLAFCCLSTPCHSEDLLGAAACASRVTRRTRRGRDLHSYQLFMSYQLLVRCAPIYPFRSLDKSVYLRLSTYSNAWGRSSVVE